MTNIGRNRGKNHERAIAKRFGGERTGNRGVAAADVVSGRFVVECKSKETIPKWLSRAMNQAVRSLQEKSDTSGRIPLVVLHETGKQHGSDIVMLRLLDFEKLAEQGSAHTTEARM